MILESTKYWIRWEDRIGKDMIAFCMDDDVDLFLFYFINVSSWWINSYLALKSCDNKNVMTHKTIFIDELINKLLAISVVGHHHLVLMLNKNHFGIRAVWVSLIHKKEEASRMNRSASWLKLAFKRVWSMLYESWMPLKRAYKWSCRTLINGWPRQINMIPKPYPTPTLQWWSLILEHSVTSWIGWCIIKVRVGGFRKTWFPLMDTLMSTFSDTTKKPKMNVDTTRKEETKRRMLPVSDGIIEPSLVDCN